MNGTELSKFNRISGLLIRFHRNNLLLTTKDKVWIQKNFIKDEYSVNAIKKSICGKKTMIRLERGEDIEKEDVYYLLSRKLGFEYKYIEGLLFELDQKAEDIYYAIGKDDRQTLIKIEIELNDLYKKYINYSVYCDYIKTLKMIIRYFLEIEMINDDKVANMILDISSFFSESTNILALRLAYDCLKQNKQEHIYNLYEKIDRNDQLYRFILVTYFYYYLDPFIAAGIMDQLEIEYQNENNYLYLYKIDVCKAKILKYQNPNQAKIYYEKARKLFESGLIILGKRKQASFYSEYASYLYYIKDYINAYKYYDKAVEQNILTSFIALLSILSLADKVLEIDVAYYLEIGNKYVVFENQLLINIYHYYVFKARKKDDYDFLEEYIIKDILPLFKIYHEKYFYEIFYNELKQMVEKSFHYKRLYQYQSEI